MHGRERHRMYGSNWHVICNRAGLLECLRSKSLHKNWRFDKRLELFKRTFPIRARFGSAHTFDKSVHFFALEAFERVTHRHIE
ncbi:MAG: hypothetical protein BWX81_01432 [Spirochaetes bacterium ADurb.Bin110]|nr:MAG: hypothetical protein BWX81_01432 [Spirochaetes bacterium ADurb.Bin110]